MWRPRTGATSLGEAVEQGGVVLEAVLLGEVLEDPPLLELSPVDLGLRPAPHHTLPHQPVHQLTA